MLISLGEGGSKSKCTTLSQTQMFILSFCPIYIIGCFKRQFSSGLPILAFQGSQLENGLFPRNLELVCKTTSQYVKPQKYLLKPSEKFGNASSLLAKNTPPHHMQQDSSGSESGSVLLFPDICLARNVYAQKPIRFLF